jgi:hypothetical protein
MWRRLKAFGDSQDIISLVIAVYGTANLAFLRHSFENVILPAAWLKLDGLFNPVS